MYGVIDIGSNTIRLLIYEIDEENKIKQKFNKKKVVGLARYIDSNKVMSKKGIEKTIEALNDFKVTLERNKTDEVYVFATAAIRNIKNTEDVVKKICEGTQIKVEVLSGEQEAFYDFVGANHAMDINKGLIIDIGGGSTELIFVNDGQIEKAVSIPIGSLNMYTKYIEKLLPTKEESKEIKKNVEKHLEKIKLNNKEYPVAYGIGGTTRGACKLSNDMFDNLPENRKVPLSNIKKIIKTFREEYKGAISEILEIIPDRIHTIMPGMIILKTIMKYYNCEMITISPFGIREGYLIENVINKKEQDKAAEDKKEKTSTNIIEHNSVEETTEAEVKKNN